MPDVGIVMPVYKQKPSYLRAAIQSVLAQTYSNFRFVIVIDGAPEVADVIDEEVRHDPRVKVIPCRKNQGVAKALNRGFKELLADPEILYLTWVSSDNLYYPQFIRLLRKELLQGPEELGLAYSCFREIDDEGRPLHDEAVQAQLRDYQAKPKEALLDFHIIGVSFMYKSRYAKLIEGYGMEPVEDYDYVLRLTDHCETRYIPVELIDYRVNSPFSVSAQLKNSSQQHRRWRNAFQTAKFQARRRRNIPMETTVLFPVRDGSPATVDLMENLLEQYYSNFQLLVVDLSTGQEAVKPLSAVPDPRIRVIAMPGMDEKEAIFRVAHTIETPFAMLYGKGGMLYYMDLENMSKMLRKADNPNISVYYTVGHEMVAFRNEPALEEPVYHELYRTVKLLEVLFGSV
ncbi:glycosyltransferase [Paenibacillus filicis]|uniref:Glycosyltransferase n=1 Tax=Paenibacillus gyeongsangnamensis TaxID=3388067 RepID=A0ABT4Q9Q4_9BACL|nr:glycosyltransferase [Paenibacillus filicis]MCZ8513590.1 glycosyltransferase [Paenibacillus filicis]